MIRFDLELYQETAVLQGIQDYQDIAIIHPQVHDRFIDCRITESQYDMDLTEKEFSNYVLCLTVAGAMIP